MITNETKFRSVAKKAVVEYWNKSRDLTKKYGTITDKKVYITWQVKAIQNFKALLGVNVEGDGMYFEATYNGDAGELYLDVYRKSTQRVIEC